MQDDTSSDDDYDHVRMPGTMHSKSRDRDNLHRAISKMKEVPFGEDDMDFLSPIGSPASESFGMGSRGKFFELKRKLEEDQANRQMPSSNVVGSEDSDGLELTDAPFENILHHDLEDDQSRMLSLTMRLDNHPKFNEMYKEIRERDHKILDLEARLSELDRQAIDMQDSISQRDKLINSKNEAINMVNTKHRKELEQKEEELRKTQQTMFDLEKNLSGIQDHYTLEKDQLSSEVELQRKKIELLEGNSEALKVKLEAYEVKTNLLEEEVTRLRIEKDELDQNLTDKDVLLSTKEAKIDELSETVVKLETTLKKMKMQFQAKLKTFKEKQSEMEEAVKAAEKVGELENRISEFINTIAELEEEKGTFFLQKMEYEESAVGIQTELENEIKKLSTINADTLKELERLNCAAEEAEEKYTQASNELAELKTTKDIESERIIQLQDQVLELTSKLEAESEAVASGSLETLTAELDLLKNDLEQGKLERQASEIQLQNRINELENFLKEYETLKTEHFEIQFAKQLAEDQLIGLSAAMESMQSDSAEAYKNLLHEKKEVEEVLSNYAEEVLQLKELRDSESIRQQEQVNEIEKLMDKLTAMESNQRDLELENENLLEKLAVMESNQELVAADTIREHSAAAEQHISEIEALKNRISELEATAQDNEALNTEIQKLGEEKLVLESNTEILDQFNNLKAAEQGLKEEIEQMKQHTDSLESKLADSQQEIESLKWEHEENIETCKQLSNEIQKLNIQKEELENAEINYEHKITRLESEYSELVEKQKTTVDENGSLQSRIVQLEFDYSELLDKQKATSNENGSLISRIVQFEADYLELLEKSKTTLDENGSLQNRIVQLEADNALTSTQVETTIASYEAEKTLSQQLRNELELLKTVPNTSEDRNVAPLEVNVALEKDANDVPSIYTASEAKFADLFSSFGETKTSNAITIDDGWSSFGWGGAEAVEQDIVKKQSIQESEMTPAPHNLVKELQGIQEQLTVRNAELVQEIEMLNTANHEALGEIGRLKQSLQAAEEAVLAEIAAKKQGNASTAIPQLESLTWEFNTLKQDFSQIQSEKHWCEAELRNKTEELKVLTLEKQAQNDDLSRSIMENEELENKLQQLSSEIEMHVTAKDTLSREVAEIKEENRLLESKLQECQQELESFKWEHEENLETCKQLAAEIQKLNDKIAQFSITEKDRETKIADLESERGNLQESNRVATELNDSLQRSILQLEAENKSVYEESKQLITKFETEKEQSNFELDFLKTELSTYRENYEVVVQENEKLKLDAASRKAVNTSSTEKAAAVIDFVDWSENKENALNKKEDAGDDGWSNFGWGDTEVTEEPITTKKPFLTNDSELSSVHAEEKRVLEQRIENLLSEYQNLDAKADRLEEDVWRIQTEKDELAKSLAEKESKVEELTASVASLETNMRKLKMQFQVKLKALRGKQTDSSIEERNSPETRQESPSPVRTEDDRQIFVLRDEISQAREEKMALSIKLSTCETNFAEATNELESMKWDYQGLQENCDVLNQEIRRLKFLNESSGDLASTSNTSESNIELEKAQITIRELKANLESKEREVKNLESEIDVLKCELLESDHKQVELSKEYETKLETLQQQYVDYKKSVDPSLVANQLKISELEQELEVLLRRNSAVPPPSNVPNEQDARVVEFQQFLEAEQRAKNILERKIELLQGKILEIEQSEMKCFEETLLLKSWTRELEIDNQKKQSEIDLYRSAGDGDMRNIKATILQEEVMRLVNELQDRDSRCESLTNEITRLMEERDKLQQQLSQSSANTNKQDTLLLTTVSSGNPILDAQALQIKLGELEELNCAINMDLRREREARRLVQEQLFFSQSSRGYGQPRSKSPTPSPARSNSRPSFPTNASSPALLLPYSVGSVPFSASAPHSPTNLQSPGAARLPTEQFQTVELNTASVPAYMTPQSPPSPVMRI